MDLPSPAFRRTAIDNMGETEPQSGIDDMPKSMGADYTGAKNTITALEANKGDVDALQKQIDDYKAAEAQRAEDARIAAEQAELAERSEGQSESHDNTAARDGQSCARCNQDP